MNTLMNAWSSGLLSSKIMLSVFVLAPVILCVVYAILNGGDDNEHKRQQA